MKKWTALLLALVMCLSLCACGGGGNSPEKESETEYTKEDIKHEAVMSLLVELTTMQKYTNKSAMKDIDVMSTTYEIGTMTENKDGTWTVKGTATLYNEYGQVSKTATFTSEVVPGGSLEDDDYNDECTVKIETDIDKYRNG